MKILLGPAGSPAASSLEGVVRVAELGLQAMELSFTHGVHMSIATAEAVGRAAEKAGVALSIHAPYYINLASPEKARASAERVLASAERMQAMGGGPVVFHPGYYGTLGTEACYEIVRDRVAELVAECERREWDKVVLAPETTGRLAQLGTL
ncbi:MAG TPA: TIM barrel protein, partial [archaeon]|nr:TIM barrel protein [archaeon]